MPRTKKPTTFKCRNASRARNFKFTKNCQTIINKFYLGNNQFININNAHINQYNFYKFGNKTSVEKTTIKYSDDDSTVSDFKPDMTDHENKENRVEPETSSQIVDKENTAMALSNYRQEVNRCDDYSSVNSVKVHVGTKLWSPNIKMPVCDENYISNNLIFLSKNVTDKKILLGKHETQNVIDEMSRKLKRTVLQDTTNVSLITKVAEEKNPAELLCRFGKIIQNGSGPMNGKVAKRFTNRKLVTTCNELTTKTGEPSTETSTPIISKTFKRPSKQKIWELSPIVSIGKRNDPDTLNVNFNRIEGVAKTLEYDDESATSSKDEDDDKSAAPSKDEDDDKSAASSKDDNWDDIFEMTNYLVKSRPENANLGALDKTDFPADTDEPQTTSFGDCTYRTTCSHSFVGNSEAIPGIEPLPTHPILDDTTIFDETQRNENPRNSLYKTACKYQRREEDSLNFSSNEHTMNETFKSVRKFGKGYLNKFERYTKVVPGKKWRRSLLAATKMKPDLNTSKVNWSVRLSFNPQNFSDFDTSTRKSRVIKPISDTERFSSDEYDSIISDSFFDETEMDAREDGELDITTAIHQRVTMLLQSDDTFFPDPAVGKIHAEERVLELCHDNKPIHFEEYCQGLTKCKKIGEGIYGEVYSYISRKEEIVLKVIPIEGERLVNLSPQKTYGEVLSEICVAMSLSGLKNLVRGNRTDGFCSILKIVCLKGAYPNKMMKLWEKYDETVGSENDSPAVFDSDQLYISLEMSPGGDPLESYKFCSARQSYSVLLQVTYALAAAECAFEFEHRDLHWGNVLISTTGDRTVEYLIDGESYTVVTFGKKATVIDYTLSRIRSGKFDIYNDLETDEEIFQADGDYQFDIYRDMRRDVDRQWASFAPKTNVRWIHYLASKCYDGVHYKTNHKTHKQYLNKIKMLRDKVLGFASTKDIVKVLNLKVY